MGQEQVNGIIQGLIAGQQRRRDAILATQNQQRLDQDNTNRQAEIQNQKDRLAQEAKQFDITTKAAQAMHKLTMLQEEQRVTGNLQQGMQVPGDTKISETAPNENGDIFETHQIPGIEDQNGKPIPITIPSRETFLRQEAQKAKALATPEHEFKEEEIRHTAENALNLEGARTTAQQQNTAQIIAAENQRAKEAQLAESQRAGQQRATQIRVAQIGQGMDPETGALAVPAEPYIQQAHNGQLSQEKLKALGLPKGTHNAVLAGIQQGGDVLPTDAELGSVQTYSPVPQLVGAIDNYNKLLTSSPMAKLKSNIPGTDEYKAANAIQGQIQALTPGLSRLESEKGKLSNTQIQMAHDLADPNNSVLSGDPVQNIKKRNALLQLANTGLDANLSRLPPGQAAILKQKTGVTNIPLLDEKTGQPVGGQPTTAQPAATHLYFDSKGNPVQQPNQ